MISRLCLAAALTCACFLPLLFLRVAAAADVSVTVSPSTGVDSPSCSTSPPCKTITHAVQVRGATIVSLDSGIFNESTIAVSSVPSLSITGVSASTVFDCGKRDNGSALSGPALIITNSSVFITGVTFQNCSNFYVLDGVGGALAASWSNITVSGCLFLSSTAQTGGAIGITAGSLLASGCSFRGNTATCPNASLTRTACSAWGGAIGTVDASSVSLFNNNFVSNTVNLLLISIRSSDIGLGSAAAGGGGCVSVMHNFNASDARFTADSNSFLYCSIQLVGTSNGNYQGQGIQNGNGYGGAISIYYGIKNASAFAARNVSSSFTNNDCRSSGIAGSVGSNGNSYGACMSVYVGSFAVSAVGNSRVGVLSVSGITVNFVNNVVSNCSIVLNNTSPTISGNVYGGALSIYIGHYSLAFGDSIVNGETDVTNARYIITGNTITNCSASCATYIANAQLGALGGTTGANAYGGGISLTVGPYSNNQGPSGSSIVSSNTTVSNSVYHITDNILTGCMASSVTSGGASNGQNAYGGGMSLRIGPFSYSLSVSYSGGIFSSSSIVSGSIIINSSVYTISANTFLACSASSITLGSSSTGANVFGGAISLKVGSHSYGGSGSSATGIVIINDAAIDITSSLFVGCFVYSYTGGISNGAVAAGGAFSLVYQSFLSSESIFSTASVTSIVASTLRAGQCSFRDCSAVTSSSSCAAGTSNAAGGSIFIASNGVSVDITSSALYNSSAVVKCAASAQSTFSIGGGLSIFVAGTVSVSLSNFTGCVARGVPQATNVYVSGGGLHVQAADTFVLQNCVIDACSVLDAFSSYLQSGGGALGTQNVSSVRILNSLVINSADDSATGIVFLQQLNGGSMSVQVESSLIVTRPSNALSNNQRVFALNVSCGSNCSLRQQQRINMSFFNSNLGAQSQTGDIFDSFPLISIPQASSVVSKTSFLNCNFTSTAPVAVISKCDGQSACSFSCSHCPQPLQIARTSSALDMSNVLSIMGSECNTISTSNLDCPYGFDFCATIINVTVGFWAQFSPDGTIGNVTQCPANYCGCRNIEGYAEKSCQLLPPLSPQFQPIDALCAGNRSGTLCGGCKENFTVSLNGYSCVSNDVCRQNLGWTWFLSVFGFFLFSIYIVFTSLRRSQGSTLCVLFYGQISSFASIPAISAKHSIASSWLGQISQFVPLISLYNDSCYGPNMSSYAATAANLSGPAIVLVQSILLTLILKMPKVSDFIRRRMVQKREFRVSFGATFANVLLLLFSSVSKVIFQLITCQDIGNGVSVVSIDGNRMCAGTEYAGLVTLAAILCTVPVLFWAGLRLNKIPPKARHAVCCAYIDSRYYWGAITLIFRLIMTILYATIRKFPSVSALCLSFGTVAMLILLMLMRPYASLRTFYLDVFCYSCLIMQFCLEVFVRSSQSLGVAIHSSNIYFSVIVAAADASDIIRYVPFGVWAVLLLYEKGPFLLQRLRFRTAPVVEVRVVEEQLQTRLQTGSTSGVELHEVDDSRADP